MLSEFRKYLNPIQVIDLADRKPTAALQWCFLLGEKKVRVLVGGGDGTVAWVLTSAHKLDLDVRMFLCLEIVVKITVILAGTFSGNFTVGYRKRSFQSVGMGKREFV